MLKKIRFRPLLGNAWIMLFVAVSIASTLTWFVYRYLADHEARLKAEMSARRTAPGIAVVVPNRDGPAATLLASDEFVSREIAPDLVYDDMIRVANFDAYRAAKLARPVLHGRPLRTGDIDALRGRDFSDILPAGQRALTLEIDTVNSTAAMVRPGNHVDIYWVGTNVEAGASAGAARPSDEGKTIRLLRPDVLILATGQDVRAQDAADAQDSAGNARANPNYSTVTVQVPVSEAARLVLAQKVGTLRLILRNSDDRSAGLTAALAEGELFAGGPQQRAAPPIEIISGGGASGLTTLAPSGAAVARAVSGAQSPAQAAALSVPSNPAAPPRSVYEEANAIARQLEHRAPRSEPDQN